MAKSLAQITAQIEKLQAQATALREKEKAGVVKRILEAIAHYGITAQDLGLDPKATGAVKRGRRPSAKKATKIVRFRDEAGNTWSGRGPRPRWFSAALASGKTQDDLQVR